MKNKTFHQNTNELDRLAAIWSLRALLHPQAFKRISKETSFTDEEAIFYSIGLEENLEKQIAPSDLYKLLKNKLKELEQQPTFRTNKLFTNIIVLGEMVGLSAIEKELLLFILVIQKSNGTRRSLEYLGMTSFPNLVHHLSYILKIKSDQIYEAFRNDGPLCASGLINLDKTRYLMDLPDRIEILDGLVQAMQEPRANFENALCNFFFKVPPPKLTLSNFQHLEEDLNILRTLLKASLMKKTAGVNILIYGSPGTGKTELVRVVAASLGVSLYEVSSQDRDGDPASDSQRLRSYLLCQSLFSRRQDCLILFDEIEDIFPKETLPLFGLIKRSGSNKSWTNRVLERNVIPGRAFGADGLRANGQFGRSILQVVGSTVAGVSILATSFQPQPVFSSSNGSLSVRSPSDEI